MTKLKLITALLFVSVYCFSQIDTTLHVERQKRDYNMKRFDKDTFNNSEKIFNEYRFETEDEDVRQLFFKNTYIEERENKLKSFVTKTSYWKETLEPKSIMYTIGDCVVGKIRYYDPQGNLTQEIDADTPFKKDIYWVGDFILQQHGVDIFVRETKDERYYRLITRNEAVPNPYYEVHCAGKDGKHIFYQIDATTGEVMYKLIGDKVEVSSPYVNGVERKAKKEIRRTHEKKSRAKERNL